MKAIVNGEFVEQAKAVIPISDRGFLYGDGFFETLLLYEGQVFQWAEHWQRLNNGAKTLKVILPFTEIDVKTLARHLVRVNAIKTGVLRIMVTRGCGPRGYSTKDAGPPNWVMTANRLTVTKPGSPLLWKLHIAETRLLSGDKLALRKHNNKLRHIMGRLEAEDCGADEALFLNEKSQVAECASGNIFWIQDNGLGTPPLWCGVLDGIARATIMALAATRFRMDVYEAEMDVQNLCKQEAVFMTLSTHGVIEIKQIEKVQLARSPLVKKLHRAYWEKVHSIIDTKGAFH